MTFKQVYYKGGNSGAICNNCTGVNQEYLATTAVSSKWFKTISGAERWMEKQGYKKCNGAKHNACITCFDCLPD